MRTSEFNFLLPPELIAQVPAPQRDHSRLLVVNRASGKLSHDTFPDFLQYLRPGDLLVLNNSKVIPARLRGINELTGGEFEILLLEENAPNDWWAMLRPGKRARPQTRITLKTAPQTKPVLLANSNPPQERPPLHSFSTLNGEAAGVKNENVNEVRLSQELTAINATVLEQNSEGHRRLIFSGTPNILESLHLLGEVPLPPYIQRPASGDLAADLASYQTVYAQNNGSVAAPTAGLHFTEKLLEAIRQQGVQVCSVTLHVGVGTFAPVRAARVSGHVMHEERFDVSQRATDAINQARSQGQRIIAVGTTTLRVLETVAAKHRGQIVAGPGRSRLFIHPPYRFQIVNALLTNFHLPQSTLLMLVSAFAAPGEIGGRDLILSAYAEAMRARYRFFSYGDAMLLL